MNQFDLAYSIATENHGILTAAEARRNGIASKTLARWVRIGRFVKYGNGVYRATQYPFSEEDQYAIAVAQCGDGAYLCGESVLGLLRLMPVNVDRIYIRAPRYLRRRLPSGYVTSIGKADYSPMNINGILCQKPEDSIRECVGTHMAEHLLEAALKAYNMGFVDEAGLKRLQKEIADA